MIRILEKNVADKIAAGEVVDRPVSIVKELIENSIDAGAGSIIVEIRKGGKSYIRVTDDGSGIYSGEAELAFMRHATSKISAAEDLDSIETLGFRGEALASIAAVSRVELITKTENEKMGLKLCIEGGQITEKTGIGCPDGTTIVVRDLFYNTPARLKFIKTDSAESGLITDLVSHIALAYPDLRVRMINNDHILFATQGRGDRLNAIMTLTSREFGSKLIPLKAEGGGMEIEGYVSGPGESKSSRRGQIFFVNGRTVNSKIMEKAVSRAYRERLFDGRYPIVYLFLEVEPDKVDVNVHPNKKEVKFHDDAAVEDFICAAVTEVLKQKEAVPKLEKKQKPFTRQNSEKNILNRQNENNENNIKNKTSRKPEIFEQPKQVDIKSVLSTYKEETSKITEEIEDFKTEIDKIQAEPFDFRELDYRGSIFGTYILATDEEYLYLLDQHAAHERIYYEKLMDQFSASEKYKQEIMVPITVTSYMNDPDWMEPLGKMGFDIEEFGPNTYAVRAVPTFFGLTEAETFVNDYIDSVNEHTDFTSRDVISGIASRACKSAVKAHDMLKDEEIRRLIDDLAKCSNPYSCPHGRPTFIKIGKYDIERRFRRK
jgi:DNA mismatch repair protein MutL